MKEGRTIYYINGKDEHYGNWMRYINCSRVEEEQNLVALQYHGEIYYKVYKQIDVGSELLVWYGEEYARELGIELEEEEVQLEHVVNNEVESTTKGKNIYFILRHNNFCSELLVRYM